MDLAIPLDTLISGFFSTDPSLSLPVHLQMSVGTSAQASNNNKDHIGGGDISLGLSDEITVIPEPSANLMILLAAAALSLRRRRKTRS